MALTVMVIGVLVASTGSFEASVRTSPTKLIKGVEGEIEYERGPQYV